MSQLHALAVPPLVRRHAQDGAWFWLQLPWDRLSPLVDAQRLQHYQRQWRAHLKGLLVAEETGWHMALAEWGRWKGPEQLFVCACLALLRPAPEKNAVLQAALQCPEPVLASALIWSAIVHSDAQGIVTQGAAQEEGTAWMTEPLAADHALLAPCLLASALQGRQPVTPLPPLWQHPNPAVRAALCCLVGRLRLLEYVTELQKLENTDNAAQVRQAAAIALLFCQQPEAASPLLAQAALLHHQNATANAGHDSLQEELRAQTLACLYGASLPQGSLTAQHPLWDWPPYLLLPALAFHGDISATRRILPFLAASHPYRYRALWALCFISGMDAEARGLTLPPHLPQSQHDAPPLSHAGRHLDSGLPEPHEDRVTQWWHDEALTSAEGPLLAGLPVDATACLSVLHTGLQDQRLAAALHAARLGCNFVDVVQPWAQQQKLLEQLKALC